jgi:hypothetical protein
MPLVGGYILLKGAKKGTRLPAVKTMPSLPTHVLLLQHILLQVDMPS